MVSQPQKILLTIIIALTLSVVVTFVLEYAEGTQVKELTSTTTITISNETTFGSPSKAFVKRGYFDSVGEVYAYMSSPYADYWNTFNVWMSLDNSSWITVPFLESVTNNRSQMADLGLISLGNPELTIYVKTYVPPQTVLLPLNVTKQDASNIKSNVLVERQATPADTTQWVLVFLAVFGATGFILEKGFDAYVQNRRKIHSIKEKLNLALISILIIIALFFILYMTVLYSLGSSLAPEAYAQIASALATTLVVVLTLGLRLIDDVLHRYEAFAQPRISNLKNVLDTGGTKSELEGCRIDNLPNRKLDLLKTSSDLAKYGRFFLTKLYPQESLDKTIEICRDLDKFLALANELKPYWEPTEFDSFLEFLIRSNTADCSRAFVEWVFLDKAKEILVRLEREKPDLIGQIRTIREKILLEIEEAIRGLDSYLEAN